MTGLRSANVVHTHASFRFHVSSRDGFTPVRPRFGVADAA
jgi:hypothetical protein